MANLFGALGLQDSDRLFNNTIGQQVIYAEQAKLVDLWNRDSEAAASIWVGGKVTNYKERFRLPGGGQQQLRGRSSMPGMTKVNGSWDVAYPLLDYGDMIGGDDVSLAYMTAQEYSVHLQNIFLRDANTYRYNILRALLNSASWTFSDELYGDLTIQPLANGDSVKYPPILGATTEATANHFLGSNYLSSAISDANDPISTIVNTLESHFGTPTAGSNVAVFINSAETAKVEGLTAFTSIQYFNVQPGTQTATVAAIDPRLQRGTWRILGVAHGATVCEWRYLPAGYMLGINLDVPPPLVERVDPADTGLGSGLQNVAKDMESPFETSFWRHRYGLGARNRLNGVAMQLVASTSYTTPTGF